MDTSLFLGLMRTFLCPRLSLAFGPSWAGPFNRAIASHSMGGRCMPQTGMHQGERYWSPFFALEALKSSGEYFLKLFVIPWKKIKLFWSWQIGLKYVLILHCHFFSSPRRVVSMRFVGPRAELAERPWLPSPPVYGGLKPGQRLQEAKNFFPTVWRNEWRL